MKFLALIFLLLSFGCQKGELEGAKAPEAYKTEVRFSPRGGCTDAIIKLINRSKERVDIAIYSFTSKKIAEALIKAHKRGVKVRVIIDYGTGKSPYCVGPLLRKEGIEVRYKKGSGGGLMHNKYAIFDTEAVITGSFNWTGSAERRNDENLLIIYGNRNLVKRYQENFKKLWNLAGLTN